MKLKRNRLICFLATCCIISLSACTNTPSSSKTSITSVSSSIISSTQHTHSYTYLYIDASYHSAICTCGDSKVEDHSWNQGELIREATCMQTSITRFTCSLCNGTKDVEGQKLPHNFSSDFEHDKDGHWHVCLNTGCDAKSDTLDHNWDSGTITVQADCMHKQVTKYVCQLCSEENFVEGDYGDHHLTLNHNESEHWYKCDINGCNYEEGQASHDKSSPKVLEYAKVDPVSHMITKMGTIQYTCSVCGYIYTEPYPYPADPL